MNSTVEKYTLVVKMDGQKEKPTMERLLYLLTKDKVVKPNALGQFIAVIEKNFEECPFEKDVIKHRKDFTVLFKDKVEYACQMTEDKDAAQFKDIIFADFIAITTQDS